MSKTATQVKQSSQKDFVKQQVPDKYPEISGDDLIEEEQVSNPNQLVTKQASKPVTKSNQTSKPSTQKGKKGKGKTTDTQLIEDGETKKKKVTAAQLAKQGGARMGPAFYNLYKQYQEIVKQQRELSRRSNLLVKGLVELHVLDYKRVKKEEKKVGSRTGFKKTYHVPQALAEFIGVPANAEYTAPKLASMVWTTMKLKGLTDKHSFKVDDDVSRIFHVSKDANNYGSDDPRGFHFFNLNSKLRGILVESSNQKTVLA